MALRRSFGIFLWQFSQRPKLPSLDALEGVLDLVELVALVLHQAERHVLLEAVGAEVGEVLGSVERSPAASVPFLHGLVLEALDVALEDPLAGDEERAEFRELGLGESALEGSRRGGGGAAAGFASTFATAFTAGFAAAFAAGLLFLGLGLGFRF